MDNWASYSAYKDSNLPWLGEIPKHWKVERAKKLFKKMNRSAKNDAEIVTCFRDGMVTLRKNRRVRGFTESIKEIGYQGICQGDLAIHAMDAFAGAIGISESDGKCSPVYSICTPITNVDAHYYARLLREIARNQWICALIKGIRERSTDFRFGEFGAQLLPLPPLSEQTAIVRFLDYYDRKIRKYICAKQKTINLLEELKNVIIHRAVTGQIDVRTNKPYPAYKSSGVEWLGNVPEHWEVSFVKRNYSIQLGKMLQNQPNKPDDIETPYLKAQHVHWFHVNTFNTPQMWASPQDIKQYGVLAGDLLVCEGGEGGRCGVLKESTKNHIIQNALHRIRAIKGNYNDFLQYVMSTIAATGWFDAINNKATIAHFTREKFGALTIPMPPLPEQAAIVEYLSREITNIDGAVSSARREIELLHEYQTRLIADVVTGKLDVRKAAAKLPEEIEEPEEPSANEMEEDIISGENANDTESPLEQEKCENE